ncbi:MAG: mannose-phosphate guanylyltransferase [Rickettsiaceae bacterium]|jgi:MurNAc alpha-1-phosphate uridylyltransferase|nr:mannose-phosphate guanylyltransferase [Rickettsiaceae bacterium]
MANINQAFILAAGKGERMKPLTDVIPKPLAKIKGKAMIDYIIEKLSAFSSINKIIVNSYYLPEILEAHLHSLNNPKIIISHETEKLETGGGMINAIPLFDANQPILIINGDVFWLDKNNSLIRKMIENFDEKEMDILLALKPKEQFYGYEGKGDFDLNETSGELSKARPESSHTYIGVQIFHPRILQKAPEEKCFSLSHFFKKAEKENGVLERIKGIEVKEKVFHVGTVKSLEDLEILI